MALGATDLTIGRVTGVGPVDGALTAIRSGAALSGALRDVAVLALASVYHVFHTADLGAKAVWQHRLGGGASGGFPGGGAQGGGAPPGGGG